MKTQAFTIQSTVQNESLTPAAKPPQSLYGF